MAWPEIWGPQAKTLEGLSYEAGFASRRSVRRLLAGVSLGLMQTWSLHLFLEVGTTPLISPSLIPVIQLGTSSIGRKTPVYTPQVCIAHLWMMVLNFDEKEF